MTIDLKRLEDALAKIDACETEDTFDEYVNVLSIVNEAARSYLAQAKSGLATTNPADRSQNVEHEQDGAL